MYKENKNFELRRYQTCYVPGREFLCKLSQFMYLSHLSHEQNYIFSLNFNVNHSILNFSDIRREL
jgi:hypothetical protein